MEKIERFFSGVRLIGTASHRSRGNSEYKHLCLIGEQTNKAVFIAEMWKFFPEEFLGRRVSISIEDTYPDGKARRTIIIETMD